MRLTISRIVLDNFRGCQHREIELDGNMCIKGENGSGKSTIFSAVEWLMTDTDAMMVKNPNVVPLGQPECVITVSVEATIDDKPISLKKVQKYREKVDDNGKVTSSVTNGYAINEVEKSYTNFCKELTDRGIDLDKYLILSNPNAFLADTSSKGREKIREILFKMAGDVTDTDVATRINATEIVNLLETYSLEEIRAKQKSTLKSIRDEVGLNNEIINAKIDGLLSSKTNIDVEVLKEQKKSYEAEIARCEKELADLSGNKADIKQKISDLRIKKTEITNKANEELNEQKYDLDKKIREMTRIIDEQSFKLSQTEAEITRKESLLSEAHQDIENQRIKYKIEQDSILDESDLSCPTCFRPYEKDKVKKIKAAFEAKKAEKLKSIKSMGEELKAKIKALDEEIDALFTDKENYTKLVEETQKLRDDAQARADELPVNVDMSSNEEYVKVVEDIERLESQLNASDDDRRNEIETSRDVARQMLNQIIGELAVADKNKDIDARVESLREMRRQAEINRANAEKIIDEVDQVEMAKNESLTAAINKYFMLVNFVLFKRLKNGNIEPTVEVMLNGKPLSSAVNGTHILLAKLDIIEGLSNFYDLHYPVFVDDAALITDNVSSKIALSTQAIYLIAESGTKELKVEKYE